MPVDPSTATGCRGFFSDRPDALRIASDEDDLGSSPSELGPGGSPTRVLLAEQRHQQHENPDAAPMSRPTTIDVSLTGMGSVRRRASRMG
jgi:hypothetical protein